MRAIRNLRNMLVFHIIFRNHPRFFKNVIFQTGYALNPVYPVILSNLKCQLPASEQIAKLLKG